MRLLHRPDRCHLKRGQRSARMQYLPIQRHYPRRAQRHCSNHHPSTKIQPARLHFVYLHRAPVLVLEDRQLGYSRV
jgi:hypothetical protein